MNRLTRLPSLLLRIAVAVLAVAWLGLWVRWLVRLAAADRFAPEFPAALMLVIVGAVALAARLTLNSPLPLPLARLAVLGVGLAAIVGAQQAMYGPRFPVEYFSSLVDWQLAFVPPELIVLVASIYLMWKGIAVGSDQIPHATLVRNFYDGFAALIVLFVLNHFNPLMTAGEAFLPILLFFATGLSALALSSFERARRQQREATGIWLALNRYWLATAASVVGGLVLLGLIVTAVVAPETFAAFSPVRDALAPYFEPVASLFALLVAAVAAPFFAFYNALFGRAADAPAPTPTPPPSVAGTPAPPVGLTPAEVEQALLGRWIITIAAVLGLFLLVAWFGARRFRRRPEVLADETRESIASRELLVGQLKRLFSRSRPSPARTLPPYLPLTRSRDDPRLIVRRAYQAMLDWAQTATLPRTPSQTPAQYAAKLARAAPEGAEAVATLTRAYLRARYAAEAPSLEEARSAESAAARLKALAEEEKRQ
jgi:hypothetical protein